MRVMVLSLYHSRRSSSGIGSGRLRLDGALAVGLVESSSPAAEIEQDGGNDYHGGCADGNSCDGSGTKSRLFAYAFYWCS